MARKKLSEAEKEANLKESRRKSDEKRKKLAVTFDNATAAKIEAHYNQKGFTSANSYLKYLIELDMQNK